MHQISRGSHALSRNLGSKKIGIENQKITPTRIEPLLVSRPHEMKSRPSTSQNHTGGRPTMRNPLSAINLVVSETFGHVAGYDAVLLYLVSGWCMQGEF